MSDWLCLQRSLPENMTGADLWESLYADEPITVLLESPATENRDRFGLLRSVRFCHALKNCDRGCRLLKILILLYPLIYHSQADI
ncbi:MAG: hypothetical protein NTU99_06370 [Pseudanabaena sp. LacPavin_0818_WC45_MAG_42_6]|nr:hypothetical protein [Pseudanabaena sp. LacPavin_0818_WC45_MAG_42_6]